MSLFLFNRNPEPGDTAAPVNSNIEVDIGTSEIGDTVALASTQVYVNGTLAFDAGVFQVGFTGPFSAYSNPQADVLRVVIDTNDPLDDDIEHTVRVLAAENITLGVLDESYTWTTEDHTGPMVAASEAQNLTTVRITYTEAMLRGAYVDCSAENPASYAISLVTDDTATRLPAVADVVVTGVVAVADDIFDLTVELMPTPGATYTITTTTCDASDNPTLAPFNTANFLGYQPFVDPDRDFDLLSLIPAMNRALDETGEMTALVECFQEAAEMLLYEIDAWPDILDPDLAPIAFVDAMLCDLGYPFSFVLTDDDKRRLVKLLRAMYQQKGTDIGIINAIRLFMGIEVTITDLLGDAGKLGEMYMGVDFILGSDDLYDIYSFCVNVPETITADEELRMNRIVDFMKRLVCHWTIKAPITPVVLDHWQLGYSGLGVTTTLH